MAEDELFVCGVVGAEGEDELAVAGVGGVGEGLCDGRGAGVVLTGVKVPFCQRSTAPDRPS